MPILLSNEDDSGGQTMNLKIVMASNMRKLAFVETGLGTACTAIMEVSAPEYSPAEHVCLHVGFEFSYPVRCSSWI